jgi:hypothetical protein
MSTMQAVIKNGRIEVPQPIDLPDGTRIDLTFSPVPSDGVDESDTSPEGIRKWIEWSERPKPDPSVFDELSAIIASNRAFQKQWEKEHSDEDAEKLRRMFE